jgi:adenylate cyclase
VSADFRVASWLVKPGLNVISGKGTTAHLEPKVMEVLVCLADHVGEAVSKEELVHTVWRDTFVSDDAIKRCIFELRRIFDDDVREPHVIETIPKRGYRLIARVNRSIVAAPPAPNSSLTRDSVAVLPFVNISADPENEFFADGITEEIINALAQIKDLHVVARSSAFSFKGKHIDPRVIGQRLTVRTILEGSVRRAGDHLRITAQLINAADGFHLWSERYDRKMTDVFSIQDEIARSIAERLKITLEGVADEALVKAGTSNLDAYQLYLKGRALLYRRGRALRIAGDCFEQAVSLDPDYALAWAGVADVYTTIAYYGLARPEASMPKALEAARRAVALKPSLAEAHNALAMASLVGAWDPAQARKEFLNALELNPRYTQARCWYAFNYLQLSAGRLEEAVVQAKLALDSDPLSSYANAVYCETCVVSGQYTEAIEVARRAVELDPESFLAWLTVQGALYLEGKFEESVVAGETALAMSGRHPWSLAFLAVALADWHGFAGAEPIYAEMLARACRQHISPAVMAVVACAVGRKDEVIHHANEALEIRDPACVFVFSPHFVIWAARLYASPGFRDIIARMGRSDWLD